MQGISKSASGLYPRGGGNTSMVSRRVVRSYQARYSMGANKAAMYDLTDAIDVYAKARRCDDPVPPTSWDDALKTGIYVLDDHGRLLPAIRDTVRLCADHGVALSFGHLSPQEMDALAEEIGAIGYRRAFIDHPFSEVFELDVPRMKRWADAGVRFALTWDELSPLLGVDPQDMVAAIRAIGPEHFMLSSDAGIP